MGQTTQTPKLVELDFEARDLTYGAVLERQARRYGDKTFLTFLPTGRRYSYRQIHEMSNQVANGLLAQGVDKGAHVAVLMENSPEHLLLVLALGKIGAVSVPINTACKGRQLEYYVAQSDATTIVLDEKFVDPLLSCSDFHGLKRAILFKGELDTEPRTMPVGTLQTLRFDSLYGSSANPPTEVSSWDLCCITYTSGTTGPSKGNMLSHAASLGYGLSTAEHQGYVESDVVYVCLPYFHVNALQTGTFTALLAGAGVALTRRYSTSRFMDEISSSGATVTNLLGAMANFLWGQPERPDDADNTLRMVSCVPVPKFAVAFEQRFGLKITSAYGLSDWGMVTAYTVNDPAEQLGSAGRARQGMEVRIVDENDFPCPPEVPGEIALRCTDPWMVASGYYRMPEVTLHAQRNLWFHTGDRGYLDADGYLFFVDRQKDAIRRRGENISSFEVQQIIAEHPSVEEAAVFPVRAETSEDEVAACVRLKPGTELSASDLVAHCQQNMAYYMVPRFVEFRDEFPRSVGGKAQKHLLRSDVEARLAAVWDREKVGIRLART